MSAERWVYISDTHGHDVLHQGIALAGAFMRDYKPDHVILGGDIVDFQQASRFVEADPKAERMGVGTEAKFVIDHILRPLREAAPQADFHFLHGNHEARLAKLVAAAAPALIDVEELALGSILQLKRLGIKEYPSYAGNGICVIGPCHFMHGERYGINPSKLILEEYDAPCVIHGHNHKETYWRRRAGSGLYDKKCLGSGCLCANARFKGYTNYTRGFVYGWLDRKSGRFDAHHATISGEGELYNELLTPLGEYIATEKRGRNPLAPSTWTVKRTNS